MSCDLSSGEALDLLHFCFSSLRFAAGLSKGATVHSQTVLARCLHGWRCDNPTNHIAMISFLESE